jgi:asparagine synthase (glutamine-hydrolysing)
MPGIAGIVTKKSREESKIKLSSMINTMMHESFYSSGTYVNEKLNLYTGWVTLKDSFSDCMPIFNEKKDIVLIFYGENYADKDLIDTLRHSGHYIDATNATYLIHLYEVEDDRFFQLLNGWFSAVLVDLRTNKVILFNDRYGMQRIYYYETNDAFYFSSEAKSLLRIKPELRKFDMKSLGEFFSTYCVLQNRTLFSNIFLLPGGSAWTFSNGEHLKKENYFYPSNWENQPIFDKETFYSKLRETLPSILPRYFYSKKPMVMSLSGGLDTRMIMACADIEPGTLPCHTFGGIYRDTFDARIAREVAHACQQSHHIMRFDDKYFSEFASHVERTIYISDGCHYASGAHDLYFNGITREIAPLRMTGKFGSEVIRNHTQFRHTPPAEILFDGDFNKNIQEAEITLSAIKKGHELTFSVFKEMPWHEYGRLAIEQSQLTLRTPYMDNELVKLMYQAPPDVRYTEELIHRIIRDYNPKLLDIMTDRGVKGNSNNFSQKVSRMFYWYFLWKGEWFYTIGMPTWLLKIDKLLKPFKLEKLIVGRHSMSYYRKWYKDQLSVYLQDILLDQRTINREYFNKGFIQEMVTSHIRGSRNYLHEIDKALTIELANRLLIEQ